MRSWSPKAAVLPTAYISSCSAARMKMRRDHVVPLSHQATALVRALLGQRREGYVFLDDGKAPISQNRMIGGSIGWAIAVVRLSMAFGGWPRLGRTKANVIAPTGSRPRLPMAVVMRRTGRITSRRSERGKTGIRGADRPCSTRIAELRARFVDKGVNWGYHADRVIGLSKSHFRLDR